MFPKKNYFGTPTPKGGPVLGVPELLLEDSKKSVFFAKIYLFFMGKFLGKKKNQKKSKKKKIFFFRKIYFAKNVPHQK